MMANLHKISSSLTCLRQDFSQASCVATWSWNAAGLRTEQRDRHWPNRRTTGADVTSKARAAAPPALTTVRWQAFPWDLPKVNLAHWTQAYCRNKKENDEFSMERKLSETLKEHLEMEIDTNDYPSAVLEKMESDQRRKLYAIKRARAARDFKDAPEKRTLPWDTIDQIRFLRQENPDEWSVAALARSFDVSEDVIVKVLKSKFTPSNRTRQKQDAVVTENTGQLSGGNQTDPRDNVLQLEGKVTKNQKRNVKKAEQQHVHSFNEINLSAGKKNLDGEDPNAAARREINAKSTRSRAHYSGKQINDGQYFSDNHGKSGSTYHADAPIKQQHDKNTSSTTENYKTSSLDTKDEELDIEFTFGKFDFENVDSLVGQVKLKPQVIRKGRNYYNENGEFLYRI